MKKVIGIFLSLFLLMGCQKETASLKGRNFKLLNALNNAEITLMFDQHANGYAGRVVNNYFGSYEIDGKSLKFSPAGATMMMGPLELMDAESNYLEQLSKVNGYSFEDGKLILQLDDGQKLEFEEIPAAE